MQKCTMPRRKKGKNSAKPFFCGQRETKNELALQANNIKFIQNPNKYKNINYVYDVCIEAGKQANNKSNYV